MVSTLARFRAIRVIGSFMGVVVWLVIVAQLRKKSRKSKVITCVVTGGQHLHQHRHPQVNVKAGVRVITMGATIKADIAHLATWLIYVVDVLFAGSLEDNLERAGWHKAYQARGNPGYVGLDKIFATQHWRSFNGRDRGTGRSDHPAISVDLTLKAD